MSVKIATSGSAYFLTHCSLVIAIWAYTIVLSHYCTIVGKSTQKNWLQLVSKKKSHWGSEGKLNVTGCAFGSSWQSDSEM